MRPQTNGETIKDDGEDTETVEARQTFTHVIDVLTQSLQRPSRWNGAIELTDSLFTSGIAHLDGRIEITRAVWRQPQYRWRTLIHKALHLFSPRYSRHEYSSSRGWEAGVVEQMRRLLRQEVFERIGVEMAEDVFAERDARHEYNPYVESLESLRRPLTQEAPDFYCRLLATPLPDRLASLRQQGEALPEDQRLTFRRTLMLAQARLGRP